MQKKEWAEQIKQFQNGPSQELKKKALQTRLLSYGRGVFLRGLIEFSNYCKNNCYYCGIRAGNHHVCRYRLTQQDILNTCKKGYAVGFRTFVLQSGEDPWFDDQKICSIISQIKEMYPDCAITLSIGEKSKETYRAFFAAGADRFLLRHETADTAHYRKLHPDVMSLENRKKCLYDLREIGFQVGAGFMVGSPFQTIETLAADMKFLEELQPHMVGLGPFLPHKETPFKDFPPGSLNLTLTMLCLVRIALPNVLLPATTALATLSEQGRALGLACGANVIMPNLSPPEVRGSYSLYDNKKCTGNEAAEEIALLQKEVENDGFFLDFSRGDSRVH